MGDRASLKMNQPDCFNGLGTISIKGLFCVRPDLSGKIKGSFLFAQFKALFLGNTANNNSVYKCTYTYISYICYIRCCIHTQIYKCVCNTVPVQKHAKTLKYILKNNILI